MKPSRSSTSQGFSSEWFSNPKNPFRTVPKATIELRPLIVPKIKADNFTKIVGRTGQRGKVLAEA
jgi:hypothetical protein